MALICLISKKATLHVQHNFFVHFFCRCFARLQRENSRNFLATRFMDPPLFSFWAFVRIAVCEKYISSWLIIPLLQGQGNNNPQRSHGIPNGETYPQIPSLVPQPRNAANEFVTRAPAKHGRLKWVRICHLSCLLSSSVMWPNLLPTYQSQS